MSIFLNFKSTLSEIPKSVFKQQPVDASISHAFRLRGYLTFAWIQGSLLYQPSSNPCFDFTPSKPPSMQGTFAEEDSAIRRSGTHGFNALELF
jgi:hypothetical protein